MVRASFVFLASCLAVVSCGKSSGKGGKNVSEQLPTPASDRVMSGKHFGADWKLGTAIAEVENGVAHLSFFDTVLENPCSIAEKMRSERTVHVSVTPKVGSYTAEQGDERRLASFIGIENGKASTKDTTTYAINVTNVDDSKIDGVLGARFDASSDVNGTFSATVCKNTAIEPFPIGVEEPVVVEPTPVEPITVEPTPVPDRPLNGTIRQAWCATEFRTNPIRTTQYDYRWDFTSNVGSVKAEKLGDFGMVMLDAIFNVTEIVGRLDDGSLKLTVIDAETYSSGSDEYLSHYYAGVVDTCNYKIATDKTMTMSCDSGKFKFKACN